MKCMQDFCWVMNGMERNLSWAFLLLALMIYCHKKMEKETKEKERKQRVCNEFLFFILFFKDKILIVTLIQNLCQIIMDGTFFHGFWYFHG